MHWAATPTGVALHSKLPTVPQSLRNLLVITTESGKEIPVEAPLASPGMIKMPSRWEARNPPLQSVEGHGEHPYPFGQTRKGPAIPTSRLDSSETLSEVDSKFRVCRAWAVLHRAVQVQPGALVPHPAPRQQAHSQAQEV
ncbi:uncharacterized protein LOC144376430 isoform X2 [Ictidomys tridecemlineatus]